MPAGGIRHEDSLGHQPRGTATVTPAHKARSVPAEPRHELILQVQCSAGNQAVTSLLSSAGLALQRHPLPEDEEAPELELQRAPLVAVQRKTLDEKVGEGRASWPVRSPPPRPVPSLSSVGWPAITGGPSRGS